jgi:hypothetical protein
MLAPASWSESDGVATRCGEWILAVFFGAWLSIGGTASAVEISHLTGLNNSSHPD